MSFYKLSNNTLVSAISVLVKKIFTKNRSNILYFLEIYLRNHCSRSFWVVTPGGTFILGGRGGGGAWTSHQVWRQNLGQDRPSLPNKMKNLGSSAATRSKSWEEIPILGSYLKFRGQNLGYLSSIFFKAKFGAPTRISEANFDLLI